MKNNLHIKQPSSFLFIIGMIVLLLVSPCKVRNSIQTSLGIPLTNVLNKSISVVNENDCSVHVSNNLKISSYQIKFQRSLPTLVKTTFKSLNFTQTGLIISPSSSVFQELIVEIPFYILFKNFKFHL